MWLITVLEVLFAGAILSLLADIIGRNFGLRSGYAPWAVCMGAAGVSLALLFSEWVPLQRVTLVSPTQSLYSSLYMVDRFTIFAAFTVLVIGLMVVLYSLEYFGSHRNAGPYYGLMLLLLGSLVGVVSAGDYLTLFLFWEGMSVAAYALVSFGREQLSLEATMKYFFMAGIGSLLALYGIALIYSVSGSIQLESVAFILSGGSSTGTFGLAFLVIGLGIEAAVVPMHTWLPDVYAAAPLPVASIVSGAVTGAAAFAILKVVQPLVPFGGFANLLVLAGAASVSVQSLQILLASLALITMLVGNLSGLVQTNLRRLLSFSSIAQTGYMLAALSTLSVTGLVAVVFTIWNHGLLKCNFFMLLGKERSAYADADLQSLRGVGKQDRPLGFLYASSSLGMVGAPPFGMFWSEILVVQALLGASSGPFFWLAVAVVANILLSIGYYYKVINTVVFGDAEGSVEKKSAADLAPPALLLLLSLLTGVLPFLFLNQLI